MTPAISTPKPTRLKSTPKLKRLRSTPKPPRLKSIWIGIRDCCNPASKKYARTVLDSRWEEFSQFKHWATSNGWELGFHIDRGPFGLGDKTYGPDHCCVTSPQLSNLLNDKTSVRTEKQTLYPPGIGWHAGSQAFEAKIKDIRQKVSLGYGKDPIELFYRYCDKKAAAFYREASQHPDERTALGLRLLGDNYRLRLVEGQSGPYKTPAAPGKHKRSAPHRKTGTNQ